MREAASAIFDRRLQPAPKKPSEFEREDPNPCLLPFIPHFVAGTCTPVALVNAAPCQALCFLFFLLGQVVPWPSIRAESRGDGELPWRTAEVVVLAPSPGWSWKKRIGELCIHVRVHAMVLRF